eukprot:XP_015575638.1 uncharacterized protein LOC8287191 isoform X1 [Ricinus communis]
MNHLSLSIPNRHNSIIIRIDNASSIIHRNSPISFTIQSSSNPLRPRFTRTVSRSHSPPSNPQNSSQQGDENDPESHVETLRVPDHWLLPPNALQESEWLRVTLHKWLDDEYCPEETNIEISKVAARSYYECLVEKRNDLGEILLRMARDLESISYQESFHGAFSSANAAVNLIAQRIEFLQGRCG